MFSSTTPLSIVRRLLSSAVCTLGALGTAHAEGYDFNRFLSGGGGGGDPAKQRIARQAGAFICVDVSGSSAAAANTVRFTLWSTVPQMNSRIVAFVFDTGRHLNLFSSMSVIVQPPNLKASVVPGQAHAFLPGMSPDYAIAFTSTRGQPPGSLQAGLAPGQMVIVSASLGSGKTINDVMAALGEGLNPATATTGLRIGLIALNLLGGPPPGVGSIQDDGGFVISAASPRCRRG